MNFLLVKWKLKKKKWKSENFYKKKFSTENKRQFRTHRSTRILFLYFLRYEQGLEDYEEAVARVEHIKEEQRSANNLDQIASIFNTLNTAWKKTSEKVKAARKVDGGSNEEDKTSQSDVTSLSTEVKGIERCTTYVNRCKSYNQNVLHLQINQKEDTSKEIPWKDTMISL